MGWLIMLGILTLLAVLPLGVSLKYDAEGPLVRLILGPIRITLFPTKQKEKKEKPKKEKTPQEKPEKAPKQPSAMPEKPQIPPKEEPQKGGSWTDFLPLVKTVLDFLGDFRRKLRMNELYLRLILASEDPCDLAVNYGRAWAAVGNLMPQLERLFVIKKRNVEIECDFEASETVIIARADITITLGWLLAIVVFYGVRALKQFLQIKNKRKGGVSK